MTLTKPIKMLHLDHRKSLFLNIVKIQVILSLNLILQIQQFKIKLRSQILTTYYNNN